MILSGECDSQVCQDRVKPVCNLRTGACDSRSAAFRNDVLGPTVGQCLSSRPSRSLAQSLAAVSVVFHLRINLNFRSMEMCDF